MESAHPHDVATILDQTVLLLGRSSLCDAINAANEGPATARISFGAYSTKADVIDVDGLKRVSALFK